jgi:hypothetical protein
VAPSPSRYADYLLCFACFALSAGQATAVSTHILNLPEPDTRIIADRDGRRDRTGESYA